MPVVVDEFLHDLRGHLVSLIRFWHIRFFLYDWLIILFWTYIQRHLVISFVVLSVQYFILCAVLPSPPVFFFITHVSEKCMEQKITNVSAKKICFFVFSEKNAKKTIYIKYDMALTSSIPFRALSWALMFF